METLVTDRLKLRPWSPDDADFVFDLYSRWEVQRFIGTVPRVMADRAEAVDRISAWRAMEHPSGDTEIGWHFHPDPLAQGFRV